MGQNDDLLRQLSRAVEQSPASVVITDLEGRITYVNPKFTQVTGYSAEEAIGKNPSLLKSGYTPAHEYENLWKTISSGGEWHGEFHNKKKNGELYWELAVISPVFDEQGNITHFLAVKEDITARKAAEQAEHELRVFAEALSDTAKVLNTTLKLDEVLDRILANVGQVVPHDSADIVLIEGGSATARIVRASGYTAFGVDDANLMMTSHPADHFESWEAMLSSRAPVLIADTRLDLRWKFSPRAEWIASFVAAPIVMRETVLGFLELNSATVNFFTPTHAKRLQAFADEAAIALENARLYAEVERLSILDDLTGMYNFRGLRLMGLHEYNHARRFNHSLAALFFDIDHFRDFNNLYSHAVGNQVLQAVARQVRGSVRGVDVAARFGGEEFVILLPEADLNMAHFVGERLRQEIETLQVNATDGPLSVTISVGATELTPEMPDIEALIDRANAAERRAKERGRNRVEIAKS